jgi:hypothetical protein
MIACGTDQAAADRLIEGLDNAESQTIFVRYHVSAMIEGEELEGEVSIAQMPPQWRVDNQVVGGVVGAAIWTGETYYTCGSTPTREACSESAVESPANVFAFTLDPAEDLKLAIEDELPGYGVTELPLRQVLGLTATCFKAVHEIEGVDEEIEICLSAEGIPLFLDGSSQIGVITVMALELGRDIPDNHFSPPYPVE